VSTCVCVYVMAKNGKMYRQKSSDHSDQLSLALSWIFHHSSIHWNISVFCADAVAGDVTAGADVGSAENPVSCVTLPVFLLAGCF